MSFRLDQLHQSNAYLDNVVKIQNGIFTAENTVAQIWDMNILGYQDEILDDNALRAELAKLDTFWSNHSKEIRLGGECRKFVFVTSLGDPTTARRALQLRLDTLNCIVDVANFNRSQSQKLFTTWLPFISTYLQYEEDDINPTHINIRSRCIANIDLLRVHPLYFLSLVYGNRYERWTDWIARTWNQVAVIETATNMVHPEWRAGYLQLHQLQSLSTVETLLNQLHATNLELCHSSTVISYAFRFGHRCLKIINEEGERRRDLGLTSLSPRQRSELEGSFSNILERFTPLSDRVSELKQRLSSQINASSNLIAQKDSRVNLAIAELQANDSRTIKGIAILTLLFLPSTLVATLWTTNLFNFQGDTNWHIYVSVSVVLTFLVICCSWFYVWIFQQRDNARWARFAAYDLGFVSKTMPLQNS
ncbi:hypothetical protein BKA60DRAFT_578930 [Fusarium oxysporum]|nr:hypothetical protein BKA60DRAFT_578930 [Fusarium oxysporum]